MVGVFNSKMPNSRIYVASFIYCNLVPHLFQVATQIQNPARDCCWACWKVSKMVSHNLIAQKLRKKIGSWEMDFCQTKDLVVCPLGLGHQSNSMTFVVYWLWKFDKDSIFQSKVFQFMPTDRQSHTHPIGGDKIFYAWKFIPFHFIMFICSLHSLIHSICEG